MKKQLLKKFYACLSVGMAFIVTAMMFSASANAQIVYTDVNPDLTHACNGNQNCHYTYALDLNNDANVDFRIYVGQGCINNCVSAVSISPDSAGNAFAISTNGAKKFLMNDTIGPAQTWQNSSSAVLRRWESGGVYTGEWIYETDKYLGLSINVSGLTYYGWVRLDVTVDAVTAARTIKDYAYNTVPNQPILAGQTTTTGIIENSFASSINLFPNPATNHLTIALGSNNKKVEVTIADITGKVIYSTTATDTQKTEVNTEDFTKGIYVVQIQTADFIGTKKLIVKK